MTSSVTTSIVTANINYYQKHEDGHMVFNIEVSFRGSNWLIEKRFNDFVTLQRGLSREFRDRDVGKLPPRRFFNRFEPQFLEERSQALQSFLLNSFVKIPVTSSESMLNFLEVAKHVQIGQAEEQHDDEDEDLAAEYEAMEEQRLKDLVQNFVDRMIYSQSVKVEPRDDAEVEERRQKLLLACGGFRDHDEHLRKFFNNDDAPAVKDHSVSEGIDLFNAPIEVSTAAQHAVIDYFERELYNQQAHPIMDMPDGQSLVTHLDSI